MSVTITSTPLDPEAALREFRSRISDAGAVVSFTGLVRGEGADDLRLILSHYPGLTERAVEGYGATAAERWPLLGWQVVHRVGAMAAGEPIVFVASASAHRRAAFEATDYLMDYLKSEAPFWKQESRGGNTRWIEPREQDEQDLSRWSET